MGGTPSRLAPRRRTERDPGGRQRPFDSWIVDVGAKTVTVYTGPGPDGYGSERIVSAGRR